MMLPLEHRYVYCARFYDLMSTIRRYDLHRDCSLVAVGHLYFPRGREMRRIKVVIFYDR